MNKKIDKVVFVKHPDMNDFLHISNWMKYGFDKGFEGYELSHNIEDIKEDILKQRALVLRINHVAIAFLTFDSFNKNDKKVTFRMTAVHPDYRRKGLVSMLHNKAIDYFKAKGCIIAEIWKVNPMSKRMSEKIGFKVEYVKTTNDCIWMYKLLTDYRKQNKTAKKAFVVWKGWDTDCSPIYSWSLNLKNNKKPIIKCIDCSWEVGIMIDGKLVSHNAAKHFFNVMPEHEDYLYLDTQKIKELNLKFRNIAQ